MKIPVNICLFTSTKGHWNVRTRYFDTVNNLNNQIPLSSFVGLFAHIKVTPGEEQIANDMQLNLEKFGFTVIKTIGDWAHGKNHQEEYLKDITKIFFNPEVNKTEYSFFLEDDFDIVCRKDKFVDYIAKATLILNENPDIVSVRIARAANERERISGLWAKHGIQSFVSLDLNGYFLATDFSNNPHFIRTRDMRNAMILLRKVNGFPIHSEHGTAAAIKVFNNSQMPIAIFCPEDIVCRHRGTPIGEEEPNDKDIFLD
jgi:hypothetical protein